MKDDIRQLWEGEIIVGTSTVSNSCASSTSKQLTSTLATVTSSFPARTAATLAQAQPALLAPVR